MFRARLEQLRPVLGGKLFGLLFGCCLGILVQLGWMRCAGCNRNTHLGEELLLPGGRAQAQQAHRLFGGVSKGVRSVGRDAKGFSSAHDRLLAAEGGLDLAFEESK